MKELNNFRKYLKGEEKTSWLYKWHDWEAAIYKHPRRDEYQWAVEDVYGNDTYDFDNDQDVELKTPQEAENNMFAQISNRIGTSPERQIN